MRPLTKQQVASTARVPEAAGLQCPRRRTWCILVVGCGSVDCSERQLVGEGRQYGIVFCALPGCDIARLLVQLPATGLTFRQLVNRHTSYGARWSVNNLGPDSLSACAFEDGAQSFTCRWRLRRRRRRATLTHQRINRGPPPCICMFLRLHRRARH